jgi:excisionase family DNA binding protein
METSKHVTAQPTPGRRLLLVHHVAKRTGLSRRTIRHLAQRGKIPAFKLGPKIWGFDPRFVDMYAEKRHAD